MNKKFELIGVTEEFDYTTETYKSSVYVDVDKSDKEKLIKAIKEDDAFLQDAEGGQDYSFVEFDAYNCHPSDFRAIFHKV